MLVLFLAKGAISAGLNAACVLRTTSLEIMTLRRRPAALIGEQKVIVAVALYELTASNLIQSL